MKLSIVTLLVLTLFLLVVDGKRFKKKVERKELSKQKKNDPARHALLEQVEDVVKKNQDVSH